ncbi:hypothetical protein Glove_292g24 [Diversispora epigaea]|uniref:Uncharacterized protein n=1 Tax=Diversispora epigaea TaxID=1348612 RepID=A0A397I093_9GLOM|nr:hypothetical protein Glove_292g24 [Diversispora epigaea]
MTFTNKTLNYFRFSILSRLLIVRQKSTETINNNNNLEPAIKYCSDLVRKYDPENYLCSFFYPKPLQKVHLGMRAFNLELVMIRENVSNPQLGKVRIQFWRETIDNVFKGKPPHQPIAQVLANSLEICKLSPIFFKRILDERITVIKFLIIN